MMGRQNVENLCSVSVLIPGIKGQIEHRIRRVAHIDGVIAGEGVAADGADGRFPLLLKAEPPGAHGNRFAAAQQQKETQGRQQTDGDQNPLTDPVLPEFFGHANHLPSILWDRLPG